MSKLDKCPNCQSQRLADVSGLYSGWESISGLANASAKQHEVAAYADRLQLCYECQKCWGYRNNRTVIDLTGRFEEAAGDSLTEALDKFLSDDFPEQKK